MTKIFSIINLVARSKVVFVRCDLWSVAIVMTIHVAPHSLTQDIKFVNIEQMWARDSFDCLRNHVDRKISYEIINDFWAQDSIRCVCYWSERQNSRKLKHEYRRVIYDWTKCQTIAQHAIHTALICAVGKRIFVFDSFDVVLIIYSAEVSSKWHTRRWHDKTTQQRWIDFESATLSKGVDHN